MTHNSPPPSRPMATCKACQAQTAAEYLCSHCDARRKAALQLFETSLLPWLRVLLLKMDQSCQVGLKPRRMSARLSPFPKPMKIALQTYLRTLPGDRLGRTFEQIHGKQGGATVLWRLVLSAPDACHRFVSGVLGWTESTELAVRWVEDKQGLVIVPAPLTWEWGFERSEPLLTVLTLTWDVVTWAASGSAYFPDLGFSDAAKKLVLKNAANMALRLERRRDFTFPLQLRTAMLRARKGTMAV